MVDQIKRLLPEPLLRRLEEHAASSRNSEFAGLNYGDIPVLGGLLKPGAEFLGMAGLGFEATGNLAQRAAGFSGAGMHELANIAGILAPDELDPAFRAGQAVARSIIPGFAGVQDYSRAANREYFNENAPRSFDPRQHLAASEEAGEAAREDNKLAGFVAELAFDPANLLGGGAAGLARAAGTGAGRLSQAGRLGSRALNIANLDFDKAANVGKLPEPPPELGGRIEDFLSNLKDEPEAPRTIIENNAEPDEVLTTTQDDVTESLSDVLPDVRQAYDEAVPAADNASDLPTASELTPAQQIGEMFGTTDKNGRMVWAAGDIRNLLEQAGRGRNFHSPQPGRLAVDDAGGVNAVDFTDLAIAYRNAKGTPDEAAAAEAFINAVRRPEPQVPELPEELGGIPGVPNVVEDVVEAVAEPAVADEALAPFPPASRQIDDEKVELLFARYPDEVIPSVDVIRDMSDKPIRRSTATAARARMIDTLEIDEVPTVEEIIDQNGIGLDEARELRAGLINERAVMKYGEYNPARSDRSSGILPSWMTQPPSLKRAAAEGALVGNLAGGAAGFLEDENGEGGDVNGMIAGAAIGAGASGLRRGRGMSGLATLARAGANALREGGIAQSQAMAGKNMDNSPIQSGGIGDVGRMWTGQAVMTLKNLLQEAGTSTLWSMEAGARKGAIFDNYRDLVSRTGQGVHTTFTALPNSTQALGTRWGLENDIDMRKLGGTMADLDDRTGKFFDPKVTAFVQTMFGMANPAAVSMPALAIPLNAAMGYLAPLRQGAYQLLNEYIVNAARTAVFDEALTRYGTQAEQLFDNMIGAKNAVGYRVDDIRGAYGDAAADAWGNLIRQAKDNAVADVKDVLGDFSTEAFKGEKKARMIFPFLSFIARSYPRMARMALDHPGVSLIILNGLMLDKAHAQAEGRPGYQVGTIPFGTDTPLFGDIVRMMIGEQEGEGRFAPLSILSPIGGSNIGAISDAGDKSGYEQAGKVMDAIGIGFNPLIETGANIIGEADRAPTLGRTAMLDQALPGREIPNLYRAGLNVARGALGGEEDTYDPVVALIQQRVYSDTGLPLEHPTNRQAAFDAANPNSELYQRTKDELQQGQGIKGAVSLISPIGVQGTSQAQLDRTKAMQDIPYTYQETQAMPYDEAKFAQRANDLYKEANPAAALYDRPNLRGVADPREKAFYDQYAYLQLVAPQKYRQMLEEYKRRGYR